MILDALMRLLAIVRRWHRRATTIRQLSKLDDHLLNDLGISRGDIRHVADQLSKGIPATDALAQQDNRSRKGLNKSVPARQSKLRVVARTIERDLQCSKPCKSSGRNCPPTAA